MVYFLAKGKALLLEDPSCWLVGHVLHPRVQSLKVFLMGYLLLDFGLIFPLSISFCDSCGSFGFFMV